MSTNTESVESSKTDVSNGNVHQRVTDSLDQPRHDDQHIATPVGEENSSEGNVGSNIELNEFVLDGKLKYGLNRYANHSLLSGDKFYFVPNLNMSSEPSSFEEASRDVKRITAMNDEMNALSVMTHLLENIVLAHKESGDDRYLVNLTNYQKLVEKFIYLILTKPDISYVVHCFSHHIRDQHIRHRYHYGQP
ncbi:hypothetical protein Tco_1073151 [Tanacetum coccineum]